MPAKNPFVRRVEQVAQLIRDLIREKNLSKGEQLPTVLELSKQFSVSKDMVGAALEILSLDGTVVTKHRYGTFVADTSFLGHVDWHLFTSKSKYTPTPGKSSTCSPLWTRTAAI